MSAEQKQEIEQNIESTKHVISKKIEKIHDILHHKTDLNEQIKTNPYPAIITVGLIGFALANFPRPMKGFIYRLIGKSLFTFSSAYISKKVLEKLTKK